VIGERFASVYVFRENAISEKLDFTFVEHDGQDMEMFGNALLSSLNFRRSDHQRVKSHNLRSV